MVRSELQCAVKKKAVDPTHLILMVPISLLMLVVLKNAWVGDDAYITFRTVDNLLHGYGPVWNTSERVDTYTNPLWMLVIAGVSLILHGVNIYYIAILVSIACTLTAVTIFTRGIAQTMWAAVLGVSFLGASKSFIDYATSGLEDPLSYLLLALFMVVFLRKNAGYSRMFLLALLAGLATFNRLDTILLYLPALVYSIYETVRAESRSVIALDSGGTTEQPYPTPLAAADEAPQTSMSTANSTRKTSGAVRAMLPTLLKTASLTLLGFTPVVVWECFSLWYYGFLFPNTAYTKLATGYTSLTLLQHGVGYFISSFQFDPVLAVVLLCGLTLPLLTRDRTGMVFALGAGLYLVYTLRIGGDFMAGRFLVLPYLLSVFIITRAHVTTVHLYWPMFAATFICAFLTPHSPWVADYNYPTWSGPGGLVDTRGVADERMAYVTGTGLFFFHPSAPGQRLPSGSSLGTQAKTCGQSVVIYESIGAFGYYAGPTVHVVDPLALGDPLLSRLPAVPGERIGHFVRAIPIGYMQTLQSGTNQIADPNIALYYSKLQVLISGNLFDPNRLKDIWLFNTGHYDYLIRGHTYQPDPNARPFNGC